MTEQTNNNIEKVFLEKKIRFIIEQRIGMCKILDVIKEKYDIKIFNDDKEIVILVETK